MVLTFPAWSLSRRFKMERSERLHVGLWTYGVFFPMYDSG